MTHIEIKQEGAKPVSADSNVGGQKAKPQCTENIPKEENNTFLKWMYKWDDAKGKYYTIYQN